MAKKVKDLDAFLDFGADEKSSAATAEDSAAKEDNNAQSLGSSPIDLGDMPSFGGPVDLSEAGGGDDSSASSDGGDQGGFGSFDNMFGGFGDSAVDAQAPAASAASAAAAPARRKNSANSSYKVSSRKYTVGGVGLYSFGYRLKNFIIILLLAALLGAAVYGASIYLDLYYQPYILYAVAAGAGLTVIYYLLVSVAYRRRRNDVLSKEDFQNIYVNEKAVGKAAARTYKHLNGAYYAMVYSLIAAFIFAFMEVGFAVALNFLGV